MGGYFSQAVHGWLLHLCTLNYPYLVVTGFVPAARWECEPPKPTHPASGSYLYVILCSSIHIDYNVAKFILLCSRSYWTAYQS